VTARELPARATPVDPAALYLALRLELAHQLGTTPPREAVTILLGQMALETGRFRSAMNYNLGGIKCPKNWPGCWQHFTTTERLPASIATKYLAETVPDATVELVTRDGDAWTLRFRGKHPVNRFVAFESLEAAVEHHVAFLLGRYRSAVRIAVETRDADAYVRECHRLKYFTADPDSYAASVASLSREYARTLPPDPVPAPQRPKDEPAPVPVTVAASAPVEAAHEAPRPLPEPAPLAPPPVAVVTLPRIGDPAPLARAPWFVRLLAWLGKVLIGVKK
jgi:hypothetical protein